MPANPNIDTTDELHISEADIEAGLVADELEKTGVDRQPNEPIQVATNSITEEKVKIGIITALLQFHSEVGKIAKNSTNPFYKSSYASLPDILTAIDPLLVKCQLVVVQTPVGNHGLETRLFHISGESIGATYYMKPKEETPQGLGSSITYQRRYALAALLSLNIDEDDDGNAASGHHGEGQKPVVNSLATDAQRSLIKTLSAHATEEQANYLKERGAKLTKAEASKIIETLMNKHDA